MNKYCTVFGGFRQAGRTGEDRPISPQRMRIRPHVREQETTQLSDKEPRSNVPGRSNQKKIFRYSGYFLFRPINGELPRPICEIHKFSKAGEASLPIHENPHTIRPEMKETGEFRPFPVPRRVSGLPHAATDIISRSPVYLEIVIPISLLKLNEGEIQINVPPQGVVYSIFGQEHAGSVDKFAMIKINFSTAGALKRPFQDARAYNPVLPIGIQ